MTTAFDFSLFSALSGVLWFGLLVCGVPTVVFCLQVYTAWLGSFRRVVTAGLPVDFDALPATVILVPAHNEEKVIAQTLSNLSGLTPNMRVLVVADNCTDETAPIALRLGAQVVTRASATLRGKGYALQHGLDHLKSAAPDVVIVLDADCSTTAADMHRLALACVQHDTPVQGIYLMHAPQGGALGSKVAAFAWLVKTMVRPMGWRAWGGTSQLMGSGFALPWHIASTLNVASGHIVEDMKLTVDLAARGQAPQFVTDSTVESTFPAVDAAQATQRRRWEHGHLSMVLTEVPPAVLKAILTFNGQLLSVALDLLVPPLSLLVLVLGGFAALGVVQAAVWGASLPGVLLASMAVTLAVGVGLVWASWGRQVLSARELLSVPGFIWRKLGVYTGFVTKRERSWTRTDRD